MYIILQKLMYYEFSHYSAIMHGVLLIFVMIKISKFAYQYSIFINHFMKYIKWAKIYCKYIMCSNSII